MKFIVCVFLVLLIIEEYHCDPCLDWLFGGRDKHNGGEKKISVGLGYSARTTIEGGRGHNREHGGYFPSYGTDSQAYRPWYNVETRHPWNRSPDYIHHSRPFVSTNIPHYWHRAPNGFPVYNNPYDSRHSSFGSHYGTPHHRTLYPPNRAPNGSPDYSKTTPPTPVEVEPPVGKRFFVTPDGIRETPAEPGNSS